MVERVCAGIVTYNPDLELFLKCLNAIKVQVNKVFVFDNASNNSGQLHSLIDNDENINGFFNKENVGIAKALNELCKVADSAGYEWIVTMDQDSICANDMVENLFSHIDNERIGIAAPRIEFRDDGKLIYQTKNKRYEVEEIRACITSGSLTRIAAWKKVGGFDEWMFIDHVDNEFCTHIYVKGFSIIRVNSAVLLQRAGEMKYISLFGGKKLLLPYYSEFRNYFICRNTVYYLRKYRKYINYKHEILTFTYSQVIKLIFEKSRWKTIKSTVKGIWDGKRAKIRNV